MAEEQAAHHLLNVLEERGLDVDLDKILLGFEDEDTKTDAAAWVEEYLQEDTLLTKEELELYQTLKRKGLLHQYESEGEPVRPILDHELSSAIESLQNSTAAIEEQCRVLEAQKDALVKLKALDKPNLEFEHLRNERRRKEGQEKARLDVAVDDVSGALVEQLNEAQRDVDLEKSTLKSYLAERLSSDDQILSRLPGIVSQIIAEDQVSEDEKSIEQWCKALVSFRTTEIKARVDAIFLDSLNPYGAQPEVSGADLNDQKAALQAEMEELHSEIASVAEMAVEHEIKKPLTEMRDRKNRDKTQARGAWLNYVLSTLQYMGKRLEMINANAADSDELHRALVHVSEAASKRMPTTSGVDLTPTKRRTSGPLSAFTPMIKLKPTKGLDLPVALQDALRHTGVSFNQDSIEALQDSLMHVQLERSRTLQEHCAASLTSTHDKLAERSSKADADLRIILRALYKHTPFQEVNLTNQKLDELLKSMERDIEAKDRELLEAEGSQLSLGDPKVRAFIAKYGK